jgi:hypothetical protein
MPKTDLRARGDPRPSALHLPQEEPPEEPGDAGRRGRARKAGQAPKPAPAKRFIEPYPFTEPQRQAIAAALTHIGLGDATAREIFIGAIAYDLAVLDDALARRGDTATPAREPAPATAAPADPSSAADTAVTALARPAQALADALAALDADSRTRLQDALGNSDRYRRDYGGAYLDALAGELTRLAAAAGTLSRPAATGSATAPKPRRKPRAASAPRSAADSGLGFIRHAAKVFEQCFEAKPAADGAFTRALGSIAEITGVAIPLDAPLLRHALGAD